MKLNLTTAEKQLATELYKPEIKGDTLKKYENELSIFSCDLTDLCEFNQDNSTTGADNIMSKEDQLNFYIKVKKEHKQVINQLLGRTEQ